MTLTIPLKSFRIEWNTEGFDWDKRTGQTKIELRPREEILTGCDARTLENDQIKEDNSCFNLLKWKIKSSVEARVAQDKKELIQFQCLKQDSSCFKH